MTRIFAGTIEGNIANGIERWLQQRPDALEWVVEGHLPDSELCELLWGLMDAEAWLESAHTEDTTFAYICSHDSRQMFNVVFYQILLPDLRYEG